jgi:hypothetical protein
LKNDGKAHPGAPFFIWLKRAAASDRPLLLCAREQTFRDNGPIMGYLQEKEDIMTFIDSPIARCEAMRTMVLTDQTQGQCAREHDCPPGTICPLCGWFVEEADTGRKATSEPHPNAATH